MVIRPACILCKTCILCLVLRSIYLLTMIGSSMVEVWRVSKISKWHQWSCPGLYQSREDGPITYRGQDDPVCPTTTTGETWWGSWSIGTWWGGHKFMHELDLRALVANIQDCTSNTEPGQPVCHPHSLPRFYIVGSQD